MTERGRSRTIAIVGAALAMLACAPAANAAIPGIPEQDGDTNGATTDITCTVQGGADAGERWCSGKFTTFDGAPVDINVAFPPAPASGPDGNFPIVGVFHGWGGSKIGVQGEWVDNGYAFFSMSDRGWGMSCGGTDPNRLMPVCAEGYNHLMDTRFEVRDAQEVFEALADRDATGATAANEGLIDPQKIGVTGGSYGGGISMALAALKNREWFHDPNNAGDPTHEGVIVPWISEGGKAMQIAAAQPDIPWTDLPSALAPNGYTLDYVEEADYDRPPASAAQSHIGVLKKSWVDLLYASGQALSNYAPAGTDPDADLITWYTRANAGEPYDGDMTVEDMVAELQAHHSSYSIDDTIDPAPLLISNGWTDDLFPADEAIRFYNRTRSQHPGTPISLMFSDHGHARGAGKPEDTEFRSDQRHAWFDHYVKGTGALPFQGVQTLTQTCPSDDMTPSGGPGGPFDDADTDLPYRASSWATLAPGEVRLSDATANTIVPGAGNPQAEATYDPQSAMDDPCVTANAANVPGTASYTLPVPTGGFTLMGSPTVVADINSTGPHNQIAARLIDVDPADSDNGVLVARALYRPDVNTGPTPTLQVFQLHPNGYHFAAGHNVKLELLSQDSPYGRPSTGQSQVAVSGLELRLPVVEAPGSLGGLVTTPAQKILPPGYAFAADFLAQSSNDFDGDGVLDSQDTCPTTPGPAANNGCPTSPGDTDRDGIPNSRDLCPTVIGIADNNGCPEAEPKSTKRKCKKRKAKKKSAAAAKKKCKRRKKK